jgi:hypothetical protein
MRYNIQGNWYDESYRQKNEWDMEMDCRYRPTYALVL